MDSKKQAKNTAYDAVIIGAGAVGCAVARELMRYRLRVAVLEKENDVAAGTSGRNSAVVHAGFNNKTGSLMAKLCVEGNALFEDLCRELSVPYKKTGKLLIAYSAEDITILESLIQRGIENGCQGLKMVDAEELRRMAPKVGGIGAMHSPNTAIFDPFLYTVALAENAADNGAAFFFEREVTAIGKENGLFAISAGGDIFYAKIVINSAGLYCDRISSMAGVEGYTIYPCRGEYYILDTVADKILDIPVYPAPRAGIGGLGVHLTSTINGNVIIGPSADYIDEKEDYASTKKGLDALFEEALQLLPEIKRSDIIGAYCGVRAKQAPADEGGFWDFVVKWEDECPGLVNLIGIESPGMTASVPIARMVCKILGEHMELLPNESFNPARKGILRFREQTPEVQAQLIREDPDYGEIVCRCQTVTKKEIKQSIENPLGTCSLAGIKYRTWATTGRCQAGYCLTRIAEILEKEYGIEPEKIALRGQGTELFAGRVK